MNEFVNYTDKALGTICDALDNAAWALGKLKAYGIMEDAAWEADRLLDDATEEINRRAAEETREMHRAYERMV